MIPLRLTFYGLYVVLGAVIIARMLSAGLHWEALTGVIFGAVLMALGAYRIAGYIRSRAASP